MAAKIAAALPSPIFSDLITNYCLSQIWASFQDANFS